MPTIVNNNTVMSIERFDDLFHELQRLQPKYFAPASTQAIPISLVIISISEQQLYFIKDRKIFASYPISSAVAGIGNLSGSYRTPLGTHQISEKIGDNATAKSIFKARINTNCTAKILNGPNEVSDADNITSRIMWLDGLQDGINKGLDKDGNNVDTHSRYIYIHGTDEEGRIGKPASHGCIRMKNKDVIELYDLVSVGCLVFIKED